MRIGSLCSGYEGLGAAVTAVLGGELAFVADIDPGACALLAHRFPGVPNLGDIKEVDWRSLGAVDILCGGFPCQDVSAAGARAGLKRGNRSGLWHEFAAAIGVLRPGTVVIENVLGLLTARGDEPTREHLAAEASRDMFTRLSWWPENELALAVTKGDVRRARQCRARIARLRKLRKRAETRCQWHEQRLIRAIGTVLADLAGLGYDAEWVVVTASAAGACHRRARLFILAFPACGRAVTGAPVAAITDGAWLEPDESLFGVLPFTGRIPASGSMAGGRVYAAGDGATGMTAGLLKTPTAQLAVNGGSQHPDKQQLAADGGWAGDANGKGARASSSGYGLRNTSREISRGEHLLPTPNAQLANDSQTHRSGALTDELLLTGIALKLGAESLPPTPRATDGTKGGPNQRGSSGDLMLPSAVMSLLPTPNATDSQGGPRALPEKRTSRGKDHGPRLRDVAPALLPTPSVADGTGGHESRSGDRKGEPLLGGIEMLLPTPTAMDSHGSRNATANRSPGSSGHAGTTLSDVFWDGQGTPLPVAVRQLAGGTDWGLYEAAIRRWEAVLGRPAPAPTVPGKTGMRLNPALPEWMMGVPEGWITGVPGLSRNAQLKLAGNGVVPAQAELALRILLDRAGLEFLGRAA